MAYGRIKEMKIAQLIQKMKENGVSLPEIGTGRNGKVLARDLETALGDYFFKLKYATDPVKGQHCQMRRAVTPMKAYRYDHLKPIEQEEIFKDDNEWVGEEKYNGWRMLITYIPDDGFCFWGGNISDVDFLPVDYTEHILLGSNKRHPREAVFWNLVFLPYVIDTEAISYDDVETLDGLVTNNTLDAIGAILGSGQERAIHLQKTDIAKIYFMCFDVLTFKKGLPDLQENLQMRQNVLAGVLHQFTHEAATIGYTRKILIDKKQRLNQLWNQGKEGMIFKNLNSTYVPAGRHKTHAIKVKRTMSGEIGDDIDAFISGWIETPEHTKAGLIGGIKLSVFIEEGGERKQHHIATVTGMPDHVRQQLTMNPHGIPALNSEYDNKVLVVDGQELSNRNRKLMHARVDWKRGFRTDKNWQDCIIELETLEEERF